jgi:hypothetical protein
LWFANGSVLQMIDPNRMEKNLILPPVHLEHLAADEKSYPISGEAHPPLLVKSK